MIGKKIAYYIFLGFVGFFWLTPFRLLYIISDGLYLLLYYGIGYRKSVVRKNLDYAFPEKSKEEKLQIERKFYKNLTDLFLESLKGYTVSKKELLKRFTVSNPELIDKYYIQEKSIIMTVAHLGNWELATASVVKDYKHKPVVLYKPISNQYIDKFVYKQRKRFGLELLSIYDVAEYFEKGFNEPKAFYMISDQYSPSKRKKKAIFFGVETAFPRGQEVYSKKYNMPVIYMDIKKPKRGHYLVSLTILEDQPNKLEDNELTQRYADFLEKTIKSQPEIWLWTHKRWKDKDIY